MVCYKTCRFNKDNECKSDVSSSGVCTIARCRKNCSGICMSPHTLGDDECIFPDN